MAKEKDETKQPFFMLNTGTNDFVDCNYQYQAPNFEYNYANTYRNEQYSNAFGNYTGGYVPNCGFNQNYPISYPGFYGFPPFLYPPGPPQGPQEPQGPQDPPDSSNDVSGQEFVPYAPPVKKKQPEDKIIKALMRCGIPKEHLKNLPRNLIKRYTPEYCGLCSQSFDTLNIARMHYICKNHLKNQKKWLSQLTDSGFRRNKEQPLKARELYCEICDVHITSKVHSESHYSGKPHRAIVEGRKNPKNPFLMQRGMEERLEQLLRREKKHLRMEQEESSDKKDLKSTQPELCCEICNTSVTCSEQMIMHLNGKRHLTKEKQHILKMMKGDQATCQDKNDTAEEDKESYARKLEEERYEFKNRPDSWDQLRSNNSLMSA